VNIVQRFIRLNITVHVNTATPKGRKNKMNRKKTLTKPQKQKRGIVGLEAAIILIAFVIIAAVFSFMVVNQGLVATERGRTAIEEGLNEASTPLAIDGTIFVRTAADGANITGILVPLKAYGVKYVPMWQNETVVTLTVGTHAWANIYSGVGSNNPSNSTFDNLLSATSIGNATLYIQNTNGDQALDSFEKGYLLINLSATYAAAVRTPVNVEVRLEKTAPLSIDFTMPESLPKDSWIGL
jgi:flagellin FlaB